MSRFVPGMKCVLIHERPLPVLPIVEVCKVDKSVTTTALSKYDPITGQERCKGRPRSRIEPATPEQIQAYNEHLETTRLLTKIDNRLRALKCVKPGEDAFHKYQAVRSWSASPYLNQNPGALRWQGRPIGEQIDGV